MDTSTFRETAMETRRGDVATARLYRRVVMIWTLASVVVAFAVAMANTRLHLHPGDMQKTFTFVYIALLMLGVVTAGADRLFIDDVGSARERLVKRLTLLPINGTIAMAALYQGAYLSGWLWPVLWIAFQAVLMIATVAELELTRRRAIH